MQPETGFIRILLEPLGKTVLAPRGAPLQDLLFAYGVEFPCGGRASCKGCRVRLVRGRVPPHPEEEALFSADEIAAGWRLGCRLRPEEDITLEVAQWEAVILGDDTPVKAVPREGLGVAVDLGTTTLVAQLVDLESGRVLGVRASLNPQAAYGSDVMSRIEAALLRGAGPALTGAIRSRIGDLISDLLAGAGRRAARLADVVIAGNTVMHHLFCGFDLEPLSHVPFQTARGGPVLFRPAELGWDLPADAAIRFLPCLGGFVGSDILAGILATRLDESEVLAGLIDLGTNGEVVFGGRNRLVCASTAAGPAFEGGLISMGMRAATGAVSEVRLGPAGPVCHVLGGVPPKGICGSGLVDAVAAGLELGFIAPSGRLAGGGPWELCPPVSLTQSDIRALQLAKGAIAAGIRIVLARLGAGLADVARVYLAGAFGNYVNRASARRIGLFGFPAGSVTPAGNTALRGARLVLVTDPACDHAALRRRVEHVPLAEDPEFQEIFAGQMPFPATAG
jgi:uncharacterized 2Fe-2S/4Fe-4S cluster protein (DUF4445 family)